jgi:hypothetical protein
VGISFTASVLNGSRPWLAYDWPLTTDNCPAERCRAVQSRAVLGPIETRDHTFLFVPRPLMCFNMGPPLWLFLVSLSGKLLLAFASSVIHGFRSLGTHVHIFLTLHSHRVLRLFMFSGRSVSQVNCCWPLLEQLFLVLSPVGPMTVFYCLTTLVVHFSKLVLTYPNITWGQTAWNTLYPTVPLLFYVYLLPQVHVYQAFS